jgi:hypothetical protein
MWNSNAFSAGDLWLKDRGVANERVNQVSGTADAEQGDCGDEHAGGETARRVPASRRVKNRRQGIFPRAGPMPQAEVCISRATLQSRGNKRM